MKSQLQALQMSFAIHTLIFLIILCISNSIIPLKKPIVIDFSIEDSQGSRVESQELPVKSQKSRVSSQQSEIGKIEKRTEPPVSETHLPAISEAQVPVPAPVPVEQSPTTKSEATTGVLSTDGGGTKTGAIVSSGGGLGGSKEEEKSRYLKAHFSYIRDRIQKNLTYPKIARERGWEGKVTVSFIVYESGYVEDVKVTESSGFDVLDKNAIETVKRASPFPRPPVRAELIIPISYKLVGR